jgi:hypothetical protein
MSKGRQTPKIYEITLQDSGITLQYKKVSQYVIDDVRRHWAGRKPKPPVEAVDTADGKTSMIPNPDDPTYALELKDHETKENLALLHALIRLGVLVDVGDPDIKAQIDEARADMDASGVNTEVTDDKLFYVIYVACGSEDLTDLTNAIAQRSGPTPDVIEATKSDV